MTKIKDLMLKSKPAKDHKKAVQSGTKETDEKLDKKSISSFLTTLRKAGNKSK